MPSLGQHQGNNFVKILAIGLAKTGKTGSLVSLVKAGYKLRILDFDNLLEYLTNRIRKECPERLDTHVEVVSMRDPFMGTSTGMAVKGKPSAWINSLKLLNHWVDGDTDLGVPGEWGGDTILVIDSLTRWCDAAYYYHEIATPRGRSGESDGRAVYGNAQDDVEKQLGALTSPGFKTNVIVIGHGQLMLVDGKTQIHPYSVGQKLSPKIPTYFPNYVMYKQDGDKRVIQLNSEPTISLANSNPDILKGTLPVETGLATIFESLRQAPVVTPPARPTTLTLQRRIA